MEEVVNSTGVLITLTEIDTGNRFTFPMNPEEISTTCGTRFQSYDIMNTGEIKIPLGENLTGFSWSGTLPGANRYVYLSGNKSDESNKSHPYIFYPRDPIDIQSWWSTCRVKGKKLRLRVTKTPINHDVYLVDYEVRYTGGMGDYEYDISFVHAKDLKISTKETSSDEDSDNSIQDDTSSSNRPSKPKGDTFTVQNGDTLWAIAEKMMNGGKNWEKLYEANKDLIKDPNLIYPGQVFNIPKE